MKTEKLVLKKKTILELNNLELYTIQGGWDTRSTNQTGSRTATSVVCAGFLPDTAI